MAKDAGAPPPKAEQGADWTDDPANPPVKQPEGFGIPGEDPILTHEEIAAIRKQAREDILRLRKQNAKQQFLEAEKARLLRDEGMVTGVGARDQMVRITINLAEYAGNILINGRPYWHGHTYTVQRHVAENLREIMQRTQIHQAEIDGKGLRSFYAKQHETVLSPVKGVINAPTRPDGGKVTA